MPFYEKRGQKRHVIKIENVTRVEACVSIKNKEVVEGVLSTFIDFDEILVTAFTMTVSSALYELQELFMDFLDGNVKTSDILDAFLRLCARITVLYVRPNMLERILKKKSGNTSGVICSKLCYLNVIVKTSTR